jgi:hypothetical protein
MPVFINRPRLVTFRLTTSEYESLKASCATEGARSISDFSRSAVLNKVEARKTQKLSLGEDLTTLSLHLGELDGVLGELRGRISRVLGSVTKDEPK